MPARLEFCATRNNLAYDPQQQRAIGHSIPAGHEPAANCILRTGNP